MAGKISPGIQRMTFILRGGLPCWAATQSLPPLNSGGFLQGSPPAVVVLYGSPPDAAPGLTIPPTSLLCVIGADCAERVVSAQCDSFFLEADPPKMKTLSRQLTLFKQFCFKNDVNSLQRVS